MERGVADQEFDLESYIDQRLREISLLEDKVLFKEVVGKLMLNLFTYTQNEYQDLEKRVLNEFQSKQSDYAIDITLTDLAHYDQTDPFMFPMRKTDIEKRGTFEGIAESLEKKEPYLLYSVYLEAEVASVAAFAKAGRTYHGIIKTEKNEYPVNISVTRNQEYRNMIQDLYHVFGANYLTWMTVCSAYLHKMFDVSLLACQGILKGEQIQEITVDFEEFQPYVRFQMIPLWNLTAFTEKTSTYPEPCMDKTNYEHRIFAHRLDANCQYLVTNTEIEITNIRRLDGDFILTCPLPDPCDWKLYRVNKRPEKIKYQYPMLSNQCKESFSASVNEMFRKSVKTKAEIARLIEAFDYSSYVTFHDVKVSKDVPEVVYTYSMDDFIEEEIRIGGLQQTMELFFKTSGSHYLNEDIMSFLVTQVQKLFPEYYCIGTLLVQTIE